MCIGGPGRYRVCDPGRWRTAVQVQEAVAAGLRQAAAKGPGRLDPAGSQHRTANRVSVNLKNILNLTIF
jgi:hypothetical protein